MINQDWLIAEYKKTQNKLADLNIIHMLPSYDSARFFDAKGVERERLHCLCCGHEWDEKVLTYEEFINLQAKGVNVGFMRACPRCFKKLFMLGDPKQDFGYIDADGNEKHGVDLRLYKRFRDEECGDGFIVYQYHPMYRTRKSYGDISSLGAEPPKFVENLGEIIVYTPKTWFQMVYYDQASKGFAFYGLKETLYTLHKDIASIPFGYPGAFYDLDNKLFDVASLKAMLASANNQDEEV